MLNVTGVGQVTPGVFGVARLAPPVGELTRWTGLAPGPCVVELTLLASGPGQPVDLLLNGQMARAGVDVRIVSPGGTTVAPILRAAWHLDYSQLLASGVRIYEYQPSMIHTKFIVADETWSLIGSANIDNRSEALNTENLLGVSDPTLAGSLDATFMDYLTRSKEITVADWKGEYGFFSQMYSRLLLVLDKQY